MPLSATGVSARTFFHWKAQGIIDFPQGEEEQQDKRNWVRLNLFQFIWLKVCVSLRDFGIPLSAIKELKDFLNQSMVDLLKEVDADEIFKESVRVNANYGAEKMEVMSNLIKIADQEAPKMPEEYKVLTTILGSLIAGMLMNNENISLLIYKHEQKFMCSWYSYKSMPEFGKLAAEMLEQPHLQIPLRKIMLDFLDEDKNEKYLEAFGLLSPNENKILEAIRKKDFKEIIIKTDKSTDSLLVEVIKDQEILDDTVKEIKRLLGLNEYSEVTVIFRNDKHLYVKNKKRLK
jgi:DNA-binding transcriptional MerR regulator